MINVMIADDHAMFRRGIKSILETTSNMRIVDEANDGSELIEKLSQKKHFHVLLLDISMPGRSGIDLIAQIHAIRPELAILMLSMHEEEQYAVRALKTGSSGYIAKASPPEELIEAIVKVSMGEKYISSKVAKNLAEYISRDAGVKLHEKLSNREYDILCSIAKGSSLSEIGISLNLSLKTVSTYKMRICKKLSCKNDAELTRYALENGLV
jgi:two-component system, NarL family, invasion response regulator UvrY